MSERAFSSELIPAYRSATVGRPPLLPAPPLLLLLVPGPSLLLPYVPPVFSGPRVVLSVPATCDEDCALEVWPWLLLGTMVRGMDPTGLRTLAPDDPVAPPLAAIARICLMLLLLLPLLPPVLCMLVRVPMMPSMMGVSGGMARKLRMVEAEELLGVLLPPDVRRLPPCRTHACTQGHQWPNVACNTQCGGYKCQPLSNLLHWLLKSNAVLMIALPCLQHH